MTVNTIRIRARQILEDAVAPYRWRDAELRDHLQTAVRRLNSRVPTTRYVAGVVQDHIPLPEADGADIPVDERYAEALGLYVAYLAYLNDATDTVNAARAESCLARAEALML